MTKTTNVTVSQHRDDGSGGSGVRILAPEDVTLVSRPRREKRKRVPRPVIYTRTTDSEWEMNVCVYREGEFRRLAMPLEQAREFLTKELDRVRVAIEKAKTQPACPTEKEQEDSQ